jgi:ribonuclease HII
MENLTSRSLQTKLRKNSYEKAAWQEKSVVCGIDEVGRGCLAGPLVTGAVILPIGCSYRHLKDSKIMSPTEREAAYCWIVKNCWYATGIVSHQKIDQINIWQADLLAMKKAVLNLLAIYPYRPSAILIDAMPLSLIDTDYKNIPIHYFYKAESLSSSVAAASIVAKVTRDRLMALYEPLFPGYHLEQHKGYSTSVHKNAVRTLGPSIIHRTSFLGKTLAVKDESNTQINFLDTATMMDIHESTEPDIIL